MKSRIIILVIIGSFCMSFSHKFKVDFRPPGTAMILDNFFFDVRELTNRDWNEYLSFLSEENGKNDPLYLNALPDENIQGVEKEALNTYFNHPSYDDYPIVGITHKQAIDYCKWRTEAVKTMLKANDITGPKSFEYRLPSQTEWELIAGAGYDKKTQKKLNKKNFDPRLHSNMKYKSDKNKEELKVNDFITTQPSVTYLPNKYGIYNLFGNVAEMVQEEGIAMGGSFQDYYEDIVPSNKALTYDGPSTWLGFRCVCEVQQ